MILGTVLVFALVAGFLFWLVAKLLGLLNLPDYIVTTLSCATLVYAFWWLLTYGPIHLGK
jgi:hypothetical protein